MEKGSLKQFYEAFEKISCKEKAMFKKVLEKILHYCKDCSGETTEKSIFCSKCGNALAPYVHISSKVGFCMNEKCVLRGVLQYDYKA